MQPNAAQWDGFARLSRTGEGIVVLFKNSDRETEIVITIPLFGDSSYRLSSVMNSKDMGIFTAKQFRDGLQLPLVEKVDIIEVRLFDTETF